MSDEGAAFAGLLVAISGLFLLLTSGLSLWALLRTIERAQEMHL